MTTQVVILRAAGSFARRFARLTNATTAFVNGIPAKGRTVVAQFTALAAQLGSTPLWIRGLLRREETAQLGQLALDRLSQETSGGPLGFEPLLAGAAQVLHQVIHS